MDKKITAEYLRLESIKTIGLCDQRLAESMKTLVGILKDTDFEYLQTMSLMIEESRALTEEDISNLSPSCAAKEFLAVIGYEYASGQIAAMVSSGELSLEGE